MKEEFSKFGKVWSFLFDSAKGRAIIGYEKDKDATAAIYEMNISNPFKNSPWFTVEWYVPDKKSEEKKEIQ